LDQKVSGLYKDFFFANDENKFEELKLELRVDIDGKRPLNVISGDLYSISKKEYVSSFRFEKIRKVKISEDVIRIVGNNRKAFSDLANFAWIEIRISLDSYPLKAEIKLIHDKGVESNYLCEYKSEFFRRIIVEHDCEEDTAPFESYNIADLLSPPQNNPRQIGIGEAFAEAGIQIIFLKKEQSFVPHPKESSGGKSVWTQKELHEVMLKRFTMIESKSQWAIWLFSALEYVISDIKGTMVLHEGENRRGCVVFQNATGWQSLSEKRMRLFIYIHELGHCFNLRHPWSGLQQDSLEWIKIHSTLSWMNYPWRYYLSKEIRGEEAFWERFSFQFSDSELIHLRHGFRKDVIGNGTY
jgi:hypothetical protein